MLKWPLHIIVLSLFFLLLSASIFPQTKAAPDIRAEVFAIKAIDNHSHVVRVTNNGEMDDEGDALPCSGLDFVSPPPMRLRVDNPIYIGAWKDFFGYAFDDMDESHVRQLLVKKNAVMAEKGDDYPSWILDKLNIDVMLANRVAMGRGLKAPRFRWVSYGDPFLLPFSTRIAREKNADVKFFYSREEKLLGQSMKELKISKLPANFDLYLNEVVTPALELQKKNGSIAVKFVAAYYRSLDFADATKANASVIYAKYHVNGEPTPAEYKQFQDYVFRYIVHEAGRLGLAIHIHTGGGCGHAFNLHNGNPILLESVINEPQTRKTVIVLIHGGYPFTDETAFLLEKPNVYADFSAQTFLLSPTALSRVLKAWLEYEPEKVLFGTDASPATPEVGWEESAWLTNHVAREALAIALTEMIAEGEITRTRASELAKMVMRENAAGLYKIGK